MTPTITPPKATPRHDHVMSNTFANAPATVPDRRDDARTPLSLQVRMLAGDQKRDGVITDFSLGGMAIQSKPRLPIGTQIVAYVDKIARIEGHVQRYIPGGFVLAYDLTETKEARVGAALSRLASGPQAPSPSPAPAAPTSATSRTKAVTLDDGACIECEVTDASILGITCDSDRRPPVGVHVTIGGADAHVVRHTQDGFIVEFDRYWQSVSPWLGRAGTDRAAR